MEQHSEWLEKGLEGNNIHLKGRYVVPGSTAIIAAAVGGSMGLIDALLKRGADVREEDEDGWNANAK